MKKSVSVISMVFIFWFFMLGVSNSQQGHRGGMGVGNVGGVYDPKTVVTITGDVTDVLKTASGFGGSVGVHLMVKTASEKISIHLGPAWYVDKQEVKIDKSDNIEVTGSRVKYGGDSVIIAASVKKGAKMMILRDVNGVPKWSGWRGKSR